jgi:hypothetical protein
MPAAEQSAPASKEEKKRWEATDWGDDVDDEDEIPDSVQAEAVNITERQRWIDQHIGRDRSQDQGLDYGIDL